MPQSRKPNLARLIYQAYPHSDLLAIDPGQDCRSLNTLFKKVRTEALGDSLFRFIIVETVEGGQGTRSGAIRVLLRARQDIETVLHALGHKPKEEARPWQCPECERQVSCTYTQLAQAGSPYCSDCDVEMQVM